MPRETIPPTLDDHGDEVHPSFGLVRVTRSQGTPRPLFDSETTHSHTVNLTIYHASRKRDLQRDWIHEGRVITEIEMSESQWAQMVSGVGSGPTSVTLRCADGDYMVPDAPYSARLAITSDETRAAAARASQEVADAFAKYRANKTVGNLRLLESTIGNLPANLAFAADSLTRHAEDVVSKSRADIEAMAMAAAERWRVDIRELDAPADPHIGIGSVLIRPESELADEDLGPEDRGLPR